MTQEKHPWSERKQQKGVKANIPRGEGQLLTAKQIQTIRKYGGTMSDVALAKIVGCVSTTVGYYRRRMGIPAWKAKGRPGIVRLDINSYLQNWTLPAGPDIYKSMRKVQNVKHMLRMERCL